MTAYYDNIDVLPIFNWDKYIKSQNNNWFIVGFDGRQPIVKNDVLPEIEKIVQDQYYVELDDRDIFNELQKMAKIDNLVTKYNVSMVLIERLRKGFAEHQQETQKEYYSKLAKLGFKIKEHTEANVAELYQVAQGIKTQIKIIENELAETPKGKPKSLMFQLKIIEKILGFTVALNPKKLVVKEFIELCKELENGRE